MTSRPFSAAMARMPWTGVRKTRPSDSRTSGVNAVFGQESLGAVVPDIHLNNLAAAHHKAIDVTVAFEWRAVGPLAVERAKVVDDRLAGAGNDVGAFHLLLHPLVALAVERRGLARMRVFAAAGESDLEIVGDVARGGLRIRHHRRHQKTFDDLRGFRGLMGCDSLSDGHGRSPRLTGGSQTLCTSRAKR